MIDDPVRLNWCIHIKKFSSYRRTVETAQFFSKELFEKFSSFKRTVRVVQFIWKELFEKFSSFKRTVQTVQFIWKELFQKVQFVELNCSSSSVRLKGTVWKSSVRSNEQFEQFFRSFERSSWTWTGEPLVLDSHYFYLLEVNMKWAKTAGSF